MSKKEDALYEAWVTEQKSRLEKSPKKLEAFNTLVAEDDEPTREIFRAAHRGEDYYRRLNEMNEETRKKEQELANSKEELEKRQAELNTWYNDAQPLNARLTREKTELEARLNAAQESLKSIGLDEEARKLDVPGVSKKVQSDVSNEELGEMKKKLQILERGLPGLLSQYGQVIHRISKEDWDIDPSAIVDYSSKKGVDLETAFSQLTAPERKTREEKKMADLEKKWKEEGRREAISQAGNPDFHRQSGPTVIDTLQQDSSKFLDRKQRVGAAVQDLISMENAGTA